ncbi:MAG: L,D-transpeptidase family protein [Actinobacteria bacterium]|nr:L,D-transpeptidase family protein [Actinomycetota bacterium]
MKQGKHSMNSGFDSELIKSANTAINVVSNMSKAITKKSESNSKAIDTPTVHPVIEDDAATQNDAAPQSDVSTEGDSSYPVATDGNKGKKSHKSLWIALCCIFGVLAAVYLGMSLFFMSHFGFNTTINDADCSFKTIAQVEDIIKAQVSDYRLEILTRDTTLEYIEGTDIDLVYVSDNQVQTLLDEQSEFMWFTRLFGESSEHTMHATVEFDETKLTGIIDSLNFMEPGSMVAPVDAYPEFNGTLYAAHMENPGTTIDADAVYDAVGEAIVNTADSLDLDEAGCYVNPKVTSETQELLDTIALYNTYVPFTLTYTFGESKEVLDATTLFSWLNIEGDGTANLDTDTVAAWVADFASRHDTAGTTREFTTIDGATASVTGGTYGWQIDQEAELEAISGMFSDKQSQTREPYYISTASTFGATDWGVTYIELNLSSQHMYYIVDGAIVFESDVVTGLPTAARATPSGVWSILEMQQNRILRGPLKEDGSYEWEAPVSYWMRVTWSGVGFHDATWQSSFGGSRYLNNGSHGCINMPYYAAQELYSLVSVGTPVVIHY